MKYIVVKLGGSTLEQLPPTFYKNIVELHQSKEWSPIIVHGGGPLISSLLKSLQIETQFINGLRVTDQNVLDIVEMVLSGSVNKQIVRHLISAKGNAFGISGVDGGLLNSQPVEGAKELGFVGEVVDVNTDMIKEIIQKGYIPVISPIGIDENGQRYNINGDIAASAIASALGANLCLISDIPGIYIEKDNIKHTLKNITKAEVEAMIEDGQIFGGMIPKVKAAIDGLVHDVPEVSIINGLEVDSLIAYCNGEEIGTKIVLNKESSYVK
ncbi:acetylglutamate kinase [Neobacillus sp. D3-1R]|uniref:acetylglutamate kinase n=1 Tax=Neobacillus sp. D3-1R TaxID=3445778 RepID=UPI003F9F57F9